jgi:hypothetical protein
MVKPSSIMPSGIELKQFGDIYLFRFNDQLQGRLEELLEKSKSGTLTSNEAVEWAGITELSRIFTFINAQLASKVKWCPAKLEDLYDNEPNSSANTATLPNT